MNPIKKWNQLGLFTRIMVGFVLGIAAGLIFGEKATKLAFLGTILTRLLTMVVAPLVLGLLICSAADVKDFKTLGKIGGKTLGIFLGGTAIAVAIGLVLCNIMQIGAGFVMESAQAYDAKEIPSIVDTLMDIIPTNPFNSLSTQNLLQIIFFSLLLGFALINTGRKRRTCSEFLPCMDRGMEGNYEHCSGIYTIWRIWSDGKYCWQIWYGCNASLYENNCCMLYYLCIIYRFCTRWINGWSVRRDQSGPFFLGHERSNAFCICNLLQCGNDTIKLKMHERVRCQ